MAIKPLPTDTSSFRKIIEGNYLYVDKTEHIYNLVKKTAGAYFLSRPRRFGKSTLISTFAEVFAGNRTLFQGLWIDSSDYDWESYPVIRLDFSKLRSGTAAELEVNIQRYLQRIARQHSITLPDGPYNAQFDDLIYELSAEKEVVILIDEYDKPLIDNLNKLDNLDNLEEAIKIRDTLKGFYAVIKAMDAHIRFAFITGISKFSKVGVFSDVNNLTDLTLSPIFATALGLTEDELQYNLADYITDFAQRNGITDEELLVQIRRWYDGFRFSPEAENVYNPFSTFLLFFHQRFSNYWFESGTPTFLIKLLHQRNYDVGQLKELELDEIAFSSYEIDRLAMLPLLFQTGYLTIKDYDPQTQQYKLYYPNYEVENAFFVYLLDAFSNIEQGLSASHLGRLITALRDHNLVQFFKVLRVLFANIDYDLQLNYEKYYQTIFYLIFMLMGLRIDAEVKTNDGRIDAVVEVIDRIYLFEFKLDKSADEAMTQIEEHRYYEKYQLRGKPITCVGANFDTETRMVNDWKKVEIAQWSAESETK